MLPLKKRFCELFFDELKLLASSCHPNTELPTDITPTKLKELLKNINYAGNHAENPPYYLGSLLIEELTNNYHDADIVKQKAFEIYTNLRRPHNKILKRKIILGEYPIQKLAKIQTKELAPESVRLKRKILEERYLKEEVILSSNSNNNHSSIDTIEKLESKNENRSIYNNSSTVGSINEINLLSNLEEYYIKQINYIDDTYKKKFQLLDQINIIDDFNSHSIELSINKKIAIESYTKRRQHIFTDY